MVRLVVALCAKLHAAKWNGTGSILTHRDYMVGLRSQITQASGAVSDKEFHSYFVQSMPTSADGFMLIYNKTGDIDQLCDCFVKYKMRSSYQDLGSSNKEGGNVVLFGHKSISKAESSKRDKGKRQDLSDVTCYTCSKKGHLCRNCPDKPKSRQNNSTKASAADSSKGNTSNTNDAKGKAATSNTNVKKPSGTMYTAMATVANDSADTYYVDSGASHHLVPLLAGLCAYQEFTQPIKISAADSGRILTLGSGSLQVSVVTDGKARDIDIEDVYYTPKVHIHLLSLGKLKGQGWGICLKQGGMELTDGSGHVFIDIAKVNNVYPVMLTVVPPQSQLAAWAMEATEDLLAGQLIQRLKDTALNTTARGGDRVKASLMTWHHWLGHPSFKTVVQLAQGGGSGMIITDTPAVVPALDACAACVASKSVHLPHKTSRTCATEYLEQVHVNIAGLMPVPSGGRRHYLYVTINDCTRAVYTRPLHCKSEAVDAFKTFKVAAEHESGKLL